MTDTRLDRFLVSLKTMRAYDDWGLALIHADLLNHEFPKTNADDYMLWRKFKSMFERMGLLNQYGLGEWHIEFVFRPCEVWEGIAIPSERKIMINKFYVRDAPDVVDVTVHEIAHAIRFSVYGFDEDNNINETMEYVNTDGHDEAFVRIFNKIGGTGNVDDVEKKLSEVDIKRAAAYAFGFCCASKKCRLEPADVGTRHVKGAVADDGRTCVRHEQPFEYVFGRNGCDYAREAMNRSLPLDSRPLFVRQQDNVYSVREDVYARVHWLYEFDHFVTGLSKYDDDKNEKVEDIQEAAGNLVNEICNTPNMTLGRMREIRDQMKAFESELPNIITKRMQLVKTM